MLGTFAVFSTQRSSAATYELPLNAEVEISGPIDQPIWITITVLAETIFPIPPPPYGEPFPGHPAWAYGIVLAQSQADGGFSMPEACSGGQCGKFAEFFGCSAQLGCGVLLPIGDIDVRDSGAASFLVSDTGRIFTINTGTASTIPFILDLTADLPDGLGIDVLGLLSPTASGVRPSTTSTPLPSALSLFAIGLAALGFVQRRNKANTTNQVC